MKVVWMAFKSGRTKKSREVEITITIEKLECLSVYTYNYTYTLIEENIQCK
jgi:hypothetical protein